METQMVAWMVYLAGGLLLGLVGWRITRPLSRYWRHFLLVSYGVWVFTPFSLNLEDNPGVYAPALFIAVLNSLFMGPEAGLDAAITLALIWMVALIISLIYLLVSARQRRRTDPASDGDESGAESY